MAIPFVTIELDRPRKLRFGMAAMIEFEQITGTKLTAMESEISVELCGQLLWIMLKQDEPELTLEKTCTLIDEYADNITEIITKVSQAVNVAFAGDKKNAQKPTASQNT